MRYQLPDVAKRKGVFVERVPGIRIVVKGEGVFKGSLASVCAQVPYCSTSLVIAGAEESVRLSGIASPIGVESSSAVRRDTQHFVSKQGI